jgi:hypothetical protein
VEEVFSEVRLNGQPVEKLLRVLFSPGSGAKYDVFEEFYAIILQRLGSVFRAFRYYSVYRPVGQRLFQQAAAFWEVRPGPWRVSA